MTEAGSAIADMHVVLDFRGKRQATVVATEVAMALRARLTGLAISFEPVIPIYPMAAPIPTEFLMRLREDARRESSAAIAAFSEGAKAAGLAFGTGSLETIAGDGFAEIIDIARLSDLVVVGQVDPDDPAPLRASLIEALLFDAAVPTLLVPYAGAAEFKTANALIAWDGSAQAARAIRAAMPLLALCQRVTVAMVSEPDKWARGVPGADVGEYLGHHGISVEVKHLDDSLHDVAATLLNAISDEGADWMVMGAYAHNRVRQLLLGGATRTVLRAATVPVLMAH
jgi:nucleotide-binding universal stress UspA family protein